MESFTCLPQSRDIYSHSATPSHTSNSLYKLATTHVPPEHSQTDSTPGPGTNLVCDAPPVLCCAALAADGRYNEQGGQHRCLKLQLTDGKLLPAAREGRLPD